MDWISKQAKLYRNLALTNRYQAFNRILQIAFLYVLTATYAF